LSPLRARPYPLTAAEALRKGERALAEQTFLDAGRAAADARQLADELARRVAEQGVDGATTATGVPQMMSGAELARHGSHARRQSDERRRLLDALNHARQEADEAESQFERTRVLLQQAGADLELLKRDRARFDAAQRKQAAHQAELETEENLESRHNRSS
jgi:hypothetical protein